MKRRDALKAMSGLVASSALGSMARGSQEPEKDIPLPELIKRFGPMMDKVPIEVANLSKGLSMISGPGGNVAALAGLDGVVVVDAFVPNRGNDLVAEVRKLGSGAITLINTHWHFDHTGGNLAMAGVGAKILAHENARKRLSTDQYNADFDLKIPASPAQAWPSSTIGDSATLYLNGEEIHLVHVAPAHTDGDVFIHFRKANVIHTGDLFTSGAFPNIDSSSNGWIGGMVAAADRILAIANPSTKIIPGHGPLATKDDLKAARDMLAEAQARIEPLVLADKTADDVVAARPLASLEAQWGKGAFKASHFTRIVYSGLVKHREKTARR